MIIYKYPLNIINQWFELPIPASSKILTMRQQAAWHEWDGSKVYIWAMIDDTKINEPMGKKLIAVCTGMPLEEIGMDGTERYIATAENGSKWVLHLFEKGDGK